MRKAPWDPRVEPLFEAERPTRWDEILGNDGPVRLLSNMVVMTYGKPGAILLGDNGTGKTTAAKIIKHAVGCTTRAVDDPNPCMVACGNCREMKQNSHNLGRIALELNAAEMNIDMLKSALRDRAYAEAFGIPVVIYIDEFHRSPLKLQDWLLTEIEKPQYNWILLISTSEDDFIQKPFAQRLPTLRFENPPHKQLRDYLIDVNVRRGLGLSLEQIDDIATNGASVRDCLKRMQSAWVFKGTPLPR